ncbi:MAG: hypothetical protein WC461_02315 [Candidatus Paceibacterota bacterium]
MAEVIKKKKAVDAVRKKSGQVLIRTREEKPEVLKKIQEEKINEAIKKIDRQFEQFEKKEEKRFKEEEKIEKVERTKFKKIKKYTLISLGGLLLLSAATIYLLNIFFVKAEIKIETKKTEWNFMDSVVADKKIVQIGSAEIASRQIPAEVFSISKNFTFSFAATGKKNVQQKAEGKITIYNAYSSGAQTLVAGTRFMSPDGKIFRLKDKVTVPGAKIVDGKISPSTIDALVIADKAGIEYNIGPQSKFTIPGFQGTPKYDGFYGSSKEAMKNGFIGEAAYPTDDDIKKGKVDAEKQLKDYTDSALSLQIPQDFKFLDGSRQFIISKETVNVQTDEKGNFSIYIEGKSSSIGFKEVDLKDLIEKTAQGSIEDNLLKIKNSTLDYGAARADFAQGKISFAVDFKGIFEEPVNVDDFKQEVVGKNEQELKTLVSSYANIQKFTVSFWPFWAKAVPKNINKISVEIN